MLKRKEKTITTSFALYHSHITALDKICKETGHSRSAVLRAIIDRFSKERSE